MSFSFGPTGISGGDGKLYNLGDWQQVYQNSSIALTTSAQDIFSERDSSSNPSANIETGFYLVRLLTSGYPFYSESFVGTMWWYDGETNANEVDNLTLHSAGHARNNAAVYARTRRVGRSSNTDLRFQVWASGSYTISLWVYVKKIG